MAKIDPNKFFSAGKVTVVGSNQDTPTNNFSHNAAGQLNQMIDSKPQEPQQGLFSRAIHGVENYGKNIGHDFSSRAQNIIHSVDDAGHGRQSVASAGFQTAGQVAGQVGDFFGEALKPAVSAIGDSVAADTSGQFQRFANSKAGDAISNTISGTISKYTEWARQHPEASRNLESSVNIGSLLLGEKPANQAVNAGSEAVSAGANSAKNAAQTGIETAGEAAGAVKNAAKPVATFGSKMAVGEDLHGALAHFADNVENVNAFRNGTKTYQSIADQVVKAHDSFDGASFKEFQNMKKGLPDIKVPNSNVVGEVKKIVADAPTLLDKEKQAVQSAIDLVKGNKDQSLKGLLDLRNRIDRSGLIRGGEDYINSNKVVSGIRNKLNEMAIERAKNYDLANKTNYSKDIIQGLKKASSNIDLLDRIKTNLIGNGRNTEQAATKINQIIGKIDDPTQYEATKNLLKEIEARTGVKLVNDLESAKTAQIINKTTKLKGGFSHPLNSASELLNKAAVKGVEKFGQMKKPR